MIPEIRVVKFGMQGIWGSTIYKGPAEGRFLGHFDCNRGRRAVKNSIRILPKARCE